MKRFRKITVLGGPTLAVVDLFLGPVLWAPAILDMVWHPLLAVLCGLHRVIGAFVIFSFSRQDSSEVLGAIFQIIKPLLLDPLRLGLAVSTAKARAFAITVKVEAGISSPVDVTGRLVGFLPAMCAAVFHGFH